MGMLSAGFTTLARYVAIGSIILRTDQDRQEQ